MLGLFLLLVGPPLSHAKDNQNLFVSVQEIPGPTPRSSQEPHLFVDPQGTVYLSWTEQLGRTRAKLRFATYQNEAWSPAQTIAEGHNWFINWADFPSLTTLHDGTLVAHWLVKNGAGLYAYSIHIAFSEDGGKTWSPAVIPHQDGTPTQHGFVSMVPWSQDQLLVTWLDGRDYAEDAKQAINRDAPSQEMTLRSVILDKAGHFSEEYLLDARVCTCCQTAIAPTSKGAIVAYRDRSLQEIRDISITRYQNDQWTQPVALHEDQWKITGCPINGPVLDSNGDQVAAAWFTASQGIPKVYVAFSHNGGQSFDTPIRIDDGNPLGRVDLLLLPDGSGLVSWLEFTSGGKTLRFRQVTSDGVHHPSFTLNLPHQGRIFAFPRMVRREKTIFLAWTQTANREKQVRTVILTLHN